MKTLFALFALTAFATAESIEPIPADKAEMVARALVQALGAPVDVPFTSVVDAKKAAGLRAGAGGLIFVPETKLTLAAVAAAGKEPLALGQLWMRGASPTVGDAAPAVVKLRTVEMGEGEEKRSAQVYFVSIAKNDAGTLELSFFAKEKEALVKVRLAKTDADENGTPVALTGHKEGEDTGVLVMTIFGSYKADVPVIKAAE